MLGNVPYESEGKGRFDKGKNNLGEEESSINGPGSYSQRIKEKNLWVIQKLVKNKSNLNTNYPTMKLR